MKNNLNNEAYNSIFKDYTNKLNLKFDNEKSANVNSMICLLNWCFLFKNNFFVNNFNNKYIKNVCDSYNTLKTNILVNTDNDIFKNINQPELKRLKFILHNYINNYETIKLEENNKLLCELINIESIYECISYINIKLDSITNKAII